MIKNKTKKQLIQELKDTKAQLAHNLHFSNATISRASVDRCLGSAVILEISTLGGKKIIEPTAIRDGLSNETIEAIKKDLARSWGEILNLPVK